MLHSASLPEHPNYSLLSLRIMLELRFHMDKDILVHMIPAFDKRGYLPPGKPYKATWQEFIERFGTSEHRLHLISGLERALLNLKQAGCGLVYVDGSFVTNKNLPGDWDGCWELEGVNINLIDPDRDGRKKGIIMIDLRAFP